MYVAQSTNKYPDFPIDRNLGVEIRFRISRSIGKSEIRNRNFPVERILHS